MKGFTHPIRLMPTFQHYAWGTDTDIVDLLNLPPVPAPVAELWMGAHSGLPSPMAVWLAGWCSC